MLDMDRIAQASAPTPLRPLYPYTQSSTASDAAKPADGGPGPNGGPQPTTPAPTPPPSPKPKKQQYQTDQSRPFVLPFSEARSGKMRVVPRSVEEAGELYRRNMRVSTELWQTTKVREEYIGDETGIAASLAKTRISAEGDEDLSGSVDDEVAPWSRRGASRATSASAMSAGSIRSTARSAPPRPDPLSMLERLEATLREDIPRKQGKALAQLEQRIADVRRLQRIELIYVRRVALTAGLTAQRAILPNMQSVVIVLLKLLLATVTANSNMANMNQSNGNSEGTCSRRHPADTN